MVIDTGKVYNSIIVDGKRVKEESYLITGTTKFVVWNVGSGQNYRSLYGFTFHVHYGNLTGLSCGE